MPIPSAPTPPSNPAPPPPPPPAPLEPRVLSVGETIEEHIVTQEGRSYRFTSPNSGTLVLEVSYDAFFWDVILEVWIGNDVFRPTASPWSPVVARSTVISGQTYPVSVRIRGFGWLPEAEYRLKVSTE